MLINAAVFDERRKSKRPPMALASVAQKAGVSQRTLARIKKNEEMNASTVKKIAMALDISVDELCSTPEHKDRHKSREAYGLQIELAAARYKVAPELIEMLAPILFVAIAELALKRRKDRLESWWEKIEELRELQPKFNADSIAELDARAGIEHLTDAYWEEMEQIDAHSLDGWADDNHDHFFSALFSVYDKFEFEGVLETENAPFTYGGYKFDGSFSEGKFPYPRESLKGFEHGVLTADVLLETADDLAGSNIDFYDPLGDNRFQREHPISALASEKLRVGKGRVVPLSRMPIELRRDDKAFERAQWIASCDGTEEIPEVLYHWEAALRVSSYQYYKDQSRKLAEQLQGAGHDERGTIQEELKVAKEKCAAWQALIMPDDEEWYAKWKLYQAQQDEATSEEEDL